MRRQAIGLLQTVGKKNNSLLEPEASRTWASLVTIGVSAAGSPKTRRSGRAGYFDAPDSAMRDSIGSTFTVM